MVQISVLMSRLPHNSVVNVRLCDPSADVYTMGFLTYEPDVLREDVLYFGDTTLLQNAVLPESPNLVLFGSHTDNLQGLPPSANVIVLDADANPFACYNALQAYFLENREQEDVIKRMLQAHFSNKGLQYLIEEASAALHNPILVIDNTYRYVAYQLGNLEQSNTPLAKVIVRELHNETLMDEVIAYIRNEGIDQKIAQTTGPLVRMNSMLGTKTMTAAVMINGICAAHIMMLEHERAFCETDGACFAALADFAAQELQKSEVWNPTTGELGAVFLVNLLNDASASEAVTRRRLKVLNFRPKPYLQMLCFHTSGQGLEQLQVEYIAGQLKPMLHHAIYARFHRQLVVLLSRDEDEGIGEFEERLLREVCALNDMTCGISNTFELMTQVHAAYEQARRAVRYGSRPGAAVNDTCLYRYHDYAHLHALDLVDRKTNLLQLCHPALMRLRAYDESHDTELMDTLFLYLQMAGSTTKAAQALTLHKNTMLYRLGRIRQVLRMDLTSGEDLFQLQMGFRILLYLGLFVPRVTMDRAELCG